MDDRASAPVVGKAMEVAVLVVFVGLVSAALFGSVVPTYRTAAGAEVGERALVAVAGQIEEAARTPDEVIDRRVAISLPRTIRGETYAVRATTTNGTPTLVLDHANAAIGGETALAVPPRVAGVNGTLRSGASPTVTVTRRPDGRFEVRLQ
ncbi:DUF7266 family protein [Salinigranum salinum]|uniref:DUF7266 family protein n=1 Tax=Salinigranum salinum TaxID=1364937 RepID=UPI00126109F1|nr:hypothetical protein [Salinigranum salinum]